VVFFIWQAGRRAIVEKQRPDSSGCFFIRHLDHHAAPKCDPTGLTKSWAIELAPHNIKLFLLIQQVNTPMDDGLAELEGLTPKEIGEAKSR